MGYAANERDGGQISKKASFVQMKRRGAVAILALAAAGTLSRATQAATIYWDGTGTSWNVLGSWSTGAGVTTDPVAIPGASDIATFSTTGTSSLQAVTLDGNQSAAKLDILAGATGGVNLLGGDTDHTLTLGTSGIGIASGAGAVTIGSATSGQNVGILIGGNQSWANNSANLLTFANTVTNVGNVTAFTVTLNGSGAGGTLFNNVISDGGTTGTTALTINTTGSGVTTLAAANTYTGATTLTAGNLQLTNTAALTSSALKLNGGVLQLRSDSSVTFATASTALSGTVGIDVNQASSGSGQTLSLGAMSLAANTTLNVTGGNGYTLSLGTLTPANSATFNVTTANLVTGAITTTSSGNLTKSGSGTWTLNGTVWPKGYPGIFTVNAGTLKLGVANAIGNYGGYGVKLLMNGGFFDLAGFSQNVASIDGGASGGTITNSSSTTAATFTVDDTNQAGFSQSYAGLLTDNGGSGKLNLTVASKDSYGHSTTLALTNSNSSYTGVTSVIGGKPSDSVANNANTLSVVALANGGVNSSIGAASNAAANIVLDYGGTLKYTGAATSTDRLFSIGGNYGGIIEASGTGAVNFTNSGTIGFNSSTNARYLALTGSNSGNNTVAATIANNTGATSLTKGGSGTWVIGNSSNSYTGVTTVGGGVLNVATLANGGVNSSIGAATNIAGNLILAGGTLQYTGAAAQSTDRLFTIAATGGSIDSSGSGVLNFTNTGTIPSSDPASRPYYTIASPPPNGVSLVQTSILATDLVVGMTVTGGGGTATAISAINGPNNITLNGSVGTWSTKTLAFSSVDRTLNLTGSNTGANTIAGILTDSPTKKLSLTKSGSGTWVLSGVSTYTGATNITGGTLAITGSGSINNTSGITINGGTLQYSSSVGLTQLVSFSGTGGKLLLDGSSSYAGAMTITNGNTLGGHGTYSNTVTINSGAILSPGNSPGQVTIGTLNLNSGSTSHMEIGGTVLGTGYDNVTITNSGGLTYGGTLEIVSYDPYVLSAQAGSYTLFSFTGGYNSSEWGNVTVDGLGLTNNSGIWTGSQSGANYSFTDSTGILTVTIPEPATATLLFGVASLGLLARRRMRRNS